MARMLFVLFVVLFVGVGSAQGQIVNVNDSDSVRLARVRVLMDQPSGSGSLLFGSGSVLTLEPERFAVVQSGSGSSGGGWLRWYRWVGMGLLAYGGVLMADSWQNWEYVDEDSGRDYMIGGVAAGGLVLLLW